MVAIVTNQLPSIAGFSLIYDSPLSNHWPITHVQWEGPSFLINPFYMKNISIVNIYLGEVMKVHLSCWFCYHLIANQVTRQSHFRDLTHL